MNKIKLGILYLISTVVILLGSYYFIMSNWFIAHALGNYKKIPYTNSLEAFQNSYTKGFRQFEVDLTLTNDNKIIVFHGYNKNIYKKLNLKMKNFSYEDFMSKKITKKISKDITPLDLQNFINLMKKHKNIKVMLHIHSNQNPQITEYVIKEIIKETNSNPQILNRFLIGINFMEELELLNKYPEFKNRHFYIRPKEKRTDSLKDIQEIINFLKNNNIKIVSMPYKAILEHPKEVKMLKQNGIYIYSFTQNNIKEILKIKIIGVDTIGTDNCFTWRETHAKN